MSTDYINRTRTKTLARHDLYDGETGTRMESRRYKKKSIEKTCSDKLDKLNGLDQFYFPGNEGEHQKIDGTTSEVFKRIVQNNNKVNSLYHKKLTPTWTEPCQNDNKYKEADRLIRRFRWTSSTGGGQRPVIKKLKTLSQKFTLYPSLCSSHLDDEDEKELRLRRSVAHDVLVKGTQRAKKELEGLCSTDSELIITKRFELFPTRSGDHNVCYFSLKNTCRRLIAFKITTTCPKSYKILPSTSFVPSGKMMNVCIKCMGNNLQFEALENQQIIFESCFIPKDIPLSQFSKNFEDTPIDQKSITRLAMTQFFVHPCSVIPMKCNGYDSIPLVKLIPPPQIPKNEARLSILMKRNYGEKVYEDMQSKLTLMYPQLRRLRRQNYLFSIFFHLISYSIFISLLGYALYLVDYGPKIKTEFISPYAQYSTPMRFLCEIRDSIYFYTIEKNFVGHYLSLIVNNFVQHPLTYCLEFLGCKWKWN